MGRVYVFAMGKPNNTIKGGRIMKSKMHGNVAKGVTGNGVTSPTIPKPRMKRVRRDSMEGSLLKADKFKEVPKVSTADVVSQEMKDVIEGGKELGEIIVEDMGAVVGVTVDRVVGT